MPGGWRGPRGRRGHARAVVVKVARAHPRLIFPEDLAGLARDSAVLHECEGMSNLICVALAAVKCVASSRAGALVVA